MAAEPRPPRITLLTDFGSADGYVAAMRGVIATRTPQASVDDASHEISPGDVVAGAAALRRYWKLYPAGTVHLVVIDPGVGSARRALALHALGRYGVGPDNGVLEPMLAEAAAVHEITNTNLFLKPVSQTFHGRDILAPVAAWLAGGGLLELAGPPLTDPVRLERTPPTITAERIDGRIVDVDRFGNLISNIELGLVPASTQFDVLLDDRLIGPLGRSYSDVERGDAIALIGSDGCVEIGVREGNAAKVLKSGRSSAITLVRRTD